MTDYHQKLADLSDQVCKDYSDELDGITVTRDRWIDSNYPWLYVRFEYSGPLSLRSLKEIEKRYLDFCGTAGGSLETIHLNRRGSGFMVKLVYVEPKDHEHTPVMDKDDHETYTCSVPGCGKTFPK